MINIGNHPDISAIKQLARSLHRQGTACGAAALIGAGMSKSARVLQNMPAPPLWGDLQKKMVSELYGDKENSWQTTSATQLAEEYRSTLGDAALVDFLKRHITDDVWEPAQIHTDLLELPWSDVMTTNYDTLLERAVKNSSRQYTPVLNEGDLAHAHGARIIKLHGTIQNMHGVIFSEEDYRTYPEKHPAFLNTARQTFIENELCLIGFSGDDPNFLSWAGWVRDILKSGARRIFLVGILNLSHSKRKLFERQNIVPIDLAGIFEAGEDQDHQKAYEIFFKYLKELEPLAQDEWPLTSPQEFWPQNHDDIVKIRKDGEFARPFLLKAIDVWKKDRGEFPGWLITPYDKRFELEQASEIYIFSEQVLSSLSQPERKSLLSELAWRQHKMLMPLSEFVLQQIVELADCAEGFDTFPKDLRDDIFQVVVQSLYEYHGREKFLKFAEISRDRENDLDLRLFIRYYQCIDAFKRLDFEYVAEHSDSLTVQNSDPIWLCRKASLLFGIGKSDKAQRLLYDAISELKALQRNDPDSMWVQSRLSWAMWIGNGLRWENPDFSDEKNLLRKMSLLNGCDPELSLETFGSEFRDALTKRANKKELVPKFDTGTFKDNSQTRYFGGPSWVRHYYGFFFTIALTGVPLKTDYVNYAATTAQQAYELNKKEKLEWYLNLLSTQPGYDSDLINEHLGRIAVARLDTALVDDIVLHVKNGIEFWRTKIQTDDKKYHGFAVEQLRTLIEVLSRLSIRMNSSDAIRHFEFGCTLANDTSLRHWWLYGPLANLLKNTFSAVDLGDRKKLSRSLLEFPFAVKVSDISGRDWPDIASIGYKNFGYAGEKAELRRTVADFIRKLSNDDSSRAEAALRLTYLFEAKLLTKAEETKFADSMWRDIEQEGNTLPTGTNLYPHIFAWLPSPSKIDARSRVYQALYNEPDKKLEGVWDAAEAVTLAAQDKRTKLFPTPDKAKRMFEAISKWRPQRDKSEESPLDFGRSFKKQRDRSIGSVLAYAVIDQLEHAEINEENAQKVLIFIDETGLTSALPALIVFLGINAEIQDEVVKRIRQALTSQDHTEIHDGAQAITKWLKGIQEKKYKKAIPRSIISGVMKALFRAPNLGLSTLIECAKSLAQHDQFNADDIVEISELLEDFLIILDYSRIVPGDPREIGAPIERLQCIELSRILLDKGFSYPVLSRWINAQPNDPLPEIRHASFIRSKIE